MLEWMVPRIMLLQMVRKSPFDQTVEHSQLSRNNLMLSKIKNVEIFPHSLFLCTISHKCIFNFLCLSWSTTLLIASFVVKKYLVIHNDLLVTIAHTASHHFMLILNSLAIERVIVVEKCELLDSNLTLRKDGWSFMSASNVEQKIEILSRVMIW